MAYTSNESGRLDIYVQPFPATGGKWLVSTAGGVQPRWRRDGKELYYVSAMPAKIMAVDVKTDEAMFQASVPRALFDVPGIQANGPAPGTLSGSYSVSADGQKFLVGIQPVGTEVSNPLSIVLNWTAMLNK